MSSSDIWASFLNQTSLPTIHLLMLMNHIAILLYVQNFGPFYGLKKQAFFVIKTALLRQNIIEIVNQRQLWFQNTLWMHAMGENSFNE